jgi:hypothetical protein
MGWVGPYIYAYLVHAQPIPRSVPLVPRSASANQREGTISLLIDPFIGDWDEQLVDDTFEQQEASMIKLIPVQTDMEDFAACHLIRRVFFRCDLHIICKR